MITPATTHQPVTGHPPDEVLRHRLHRVAGQVLGVEHMLTAHRPR